MNNEKICSNCKYWQVDLQLNGAGQKERCRLGKGNTNPGDTCSRFAHVSSFDNLQNPGRFQDEYHKLQF